MNANDKSLPIYEEVLLLALRDKKGTPHFGVHLQFALAGAIVAELLIRKKVGVETDRKRKFLVVRDSVITGDVLLDETLSAITWLGILVLSLGILLTAIRPPSGA